MKKRVLSLLMALALCFTMLPTAAFAEPAGGGDVYTVDKDTAAQDQQKQDQQKQDEAVQAAQALIDALPDEVTADGAEALQAQLIAIDAALEKLTEEQLAALDMTRYAALCEAMTQLTAEQAAHANHALCRHGSSCKICPDAAKNAFGSAKKLTSKENKTSTGVTYYTLCIDGKDVATEPVGEMNCYVLSAGSYYLEGEVTYEHPICIRAGTVALCLNGNRLQFNRGPSTEGYALIVMDGATLNLTDCGEDGEVAADKGTSVRVEDSTSAFNMYGGSITASVSTKGSFAMYGGAITGSSGSGVTVYNGSFVMKDGTISDNKTPSGNGGGVNMQGGSFTMEGGTITSNSAGSGGGVYVYTNCTFTMTGGSITSNTATGSGGGVRMYNGTFTMTDGTITDNSAGEGGGVHQTYGSTVKLSGTPTITGNEGTDGAADNVYLGRDAVLTLADELKTGASIGVTTKNDPMASPGYVTIAQSDGTYIPKESDKEKFSDDTNSGYRIVLEESEIRMIGPAEHEHPSCGDMNCKEHENAQWTAVSDLSKIWRGRADAINYYYLTKDIELSSKTWSAPTYTMLDLNGHTITAKGDFDAITVSGNKTFTLTDCKGTGKITHASGATGSGVYVEGSSTSKAQFSMYGGTVTGNAGRSVEIYGSTKICGGGMYVGQYATVNMYGGSITGNTADNGGGVYVGFTTTNGGNSYFYMYGGSITDNTATNGGGVYDVYSGTFNMRGGSITGNIAAEHGGGVNYGGSTGLFVSGNVQITGNKNASDENDNVYVPVYSNAAPPSPPFYIGSDGLDKSARIGVTIGTELTAGGHLPVAWLSAVADYNEGNFIADKGSGCVFLVEPNEYDKTYGNFVVNLYNGMPHRHPVCGDTACTDSHTDATFQPLTADKLGVKLYNSNGVNYYYRDLPAGNWYLTEDFKPDATLRITGEVNLCLNGYSIIPTDGDCVIRLDENDSASLTLCDCSDAQSGKITTNFKGRGVSVTKGSFTMYGGSIANNGSTTSGYNGAGVFVDSDAAFTMYGGEIADNKANANAGGGVYSFGTFNLYGGTITGNSANIGGGVYAGGSASFTMNGSAVITGNKATGTGDINNGNGGGVYTQVKTFKLISGTITDNTAANNGGGVYTGAANSYMSGGTISANKAEKGGGVYVGLGSGFTLTNGTIGGASEADANTAGFGGGVYVNDGGVFTAQGGTITGNRAQYSGGGVYADSVLKLSGNVAITGNTARREGGGVYAKTLTVSDSVQISGNTADDGGGVFVGNGSFTMSGGSITGNTATGIINSSAGNGGGVYVGNISGTNASFTMTGGSITGNSAANRGSGVFMFKAPMTVSGSVQIKDNWKNGTLSGGVYVKGTDGSANNLYLYDADKKQQAVTIDAAGLNSDASICMTTQVELSASGGSVTVATKASALTDADKAAFTSDAGYGKAYMGDTRLLFVTGTHNHPDCGAACGHDGTHNDVEWIGVSSVYAIKAAGHYYLTADDDAPSTWQPVDGVVLCLNGHGIANRQTNYAIFNVRNGVHFTLTDCNGSSGSKYFKIESDTGRWDYSHEGQEGAFAVGGGHIYRVHTGYGETSTNGLVTVASGGAFDMYGGTICGGVAKENNGGGVYVNNGGAFNMYGGAVTGNVAIKGSGVYVEAGGSFTVGGAANVTGNVNNNVFLANDAVITIDKSLTNSASIGVTTATTPTSGSSVKIATGAAGERNYAAIFTPDATDGDYVVTRQGTELVLAVHTHDWQYTLSEDKATITVTCANEDGHCPDTNGGSVTLVKPAHTVYGDGKDENATLNNTLTSSIQVPDIVYSKGGTPLNYAPVSAGDYTASITLGGVTASVNYTIDKATLTASDFTFTAPSDLTYDGSVKLSSVIPQVGGGMSITPSYHDESGNEVSSAINVGTYKVHITVTESPNHKAVDDLTSDTWTFTILPRSITVTVDETSRHYGDPDPNFTAQVTTGELADRDSIASLGLALTSTATTTSNVGKYDVTGSANNKNYTVTIDGTKKLTVDPKTLEASDLKFTENSTFTKVYDGTTNATGITVSVKDSAVVNTGDELPALSGTFAYNSKGVKDASKVTFTTTGSSSRNYILPANLTMEHEATITKRVITIQSVDVQPKQYDRDTNAWSCITNVNFDNLVNGETLIKSGTYNGGYVIGDYGINRANFNSANVGEATTISGIVGLVNNNLNYTFGSEDETAAFTTTGSITPANSWAQNSANLNIRYNNRDAQTYQTAWSSLPTGQRWTYNLEDTTFTGNAALAKNEIDADTGVLSYQLSAGDVDGTVTWKITASCANYQPFTLTVTLTLIDREEQADFKFENNTTALTKTYGDTDFAVAATGAAEGSAVTYESTDPTVATVDENGKVTIHAAGTTTIKATASETKDYAEEEISYTLTVNPKLVTRDMIAAIGDQGYTGSPIQPEPEIKDGNVTLVKGTDFDFSYGTNTNAASGGTVTINGRGNYTGTASVTFDILRKSITGAVITLTGDTFDYTGSEQTVTVASVRLDGWTPEITYAVVGGDKATDAGTNTLTIKGTDNYTGTADVTWTINRIDPQLADFDVTPDLAAALVYDGDPKTVAATAKSDIHGMGDVTVKYNGSTERPTDAGSYAVTIDVSDGANYNAKTGIAVGTLTIDKAAAPVLADIPFTCKYTLTGEKTVHVSGLVPGAAGYTLGAAVGDTGIISGASVDANGVVTYTLTGTGKAGDSVTLPVTISSANYADAVVSVVITLSARDDQAAVRVTGGTTVVYGQTLQLGFSGGSGTGKVSYTVVNGTGEATIDANGLLTPVKVGSVTVTATREGDSDYNAATSAPVEITITKATPTGEPKYTEIKTGGKTLDDAALTLIGSTISLNNGETVSLADGKLEWIDEEGNVLPGSTRVEANKTYKWRFTPTNANYTVLEGETQLYSGSSSGDRYTRYTVQVTVSGNGTVSPSGWVRVREGLDQTFTITPDKGYAVAKVLVDGRNVGAVTSYTLRDVTEDHTIQVIFMKANGNPQTGVDAAQSTVGSGR